MNMLCYEDAFSQFNTKPAVPLCINCGKPWLQGAGGCQEASGGLGPCSTNNKQKNFLELYSLEFIMELDAFHYKTTDTNLTENVILPKYPDLDYSVIHRDYFRKYLGLAAFSPLYNVMNQFRKMKYQVALDGNSEKIAGKYKSLMDQWMKTQDYEIARESVRSGPTSGQAAEPAPAEPKRRKRDSAEKVEVSSSLLTSDGNHAQAVQVANGQEAPAPSIVTDHVRTMAKSLLLSCFVSRPVANGASDPTMTTFGHEECAVSMTDRERRGITTSTTARQTLSALKNHGFAILDGRNFLQKAYETMIARLHTQAVKYAAFFQDEDGNFSFDMAEGVQQDYLIFAAQKNAGDIFNRLPDDPLIGRGAHNREISTTDWNLGIEGERQEIKLSNFPKPPYDSDRLNAGYLVTLELFDTSRASIQSMVQTLTGPSRTLASMHMSSIVVSNSNASGTHKRKDTKTAGQFYHVDLLAKEQRTAFSALGMMTGPDPIIKSPSLRESKTVHASTSDKSEAGSAGGATGSRHRIGAVGLVLKSHISVRWMFNFHKENFEPLRRWLLDSPNGRAMLQNMPAVPPDTTDDSRIDIIWDLVVAEALVSAELQPWEIIELELNRNEWIVFDTDLVHFGAPYPRRNGHSGWHFRMHHYLMQHNTASPLDRLAAGYTQGLTDSILRPLRRMVPV